MPPPGLTAQKDNKPLNTVCSSPVQQLVLECHIWVMGATQTIVTNTLWVAGLVPETAAKKTMGEHLTIMFGTSAPTTMRRWGSRSQAWC